MHVHLHAAPALIQALRARLLPVLVNLGLAERWR